MIDTLPYGTKDGDTRGNNNDRYDLEHGVQTDVGRPDFCDVTRMEEHFDVHVFRQYQLKENVKNYFNY